jgi:hypothetical protein
MQDGVVGCRQIMIRDADHQDNVKSKEAHVWFALQVCLHAVRDTENIPGRNDDVGRGIRICGRLWGPTQRTCGSNTDRSPEF